MRRRGRRTDAPQHCEDDRCRSRRGRRYGRRVTGGAGTTAAGWLFVATGPPKYPGGMRSQALGSRKENASERRMRGVPPAMCKAVRQSIARPDCRHPTRRRRSWRIDIAIRRSAPARRRHAANGACGEGPVWRPSPARPFFSSHGHVGGMPERASP